MAEVRFQEMFPHGADATPYRRIDGAWVGSDAFRGAPVLTVDAAALTRLAFEAVRDVSHLFRPGMQVRAPRRRGTSWALEGTA